MRRTEIILAAIGMLSCVFMLFHIPGFRLLFILSMNLLSLFYFFFSYFLLYELPLFKRVIKPADDHQNVRNPVLPVLFGFFASALIVGVVFIANHYPGGKTMTLSGIFPLVVLSVITLIKNRKKKTRFNMNLITRGAILAVIGILALAYP